MTLQGAIKQLHELRCNEDMPVFFKPVIAEVINILLMDAEEVRHGRWVMNERGVYECSICGRVPTAEQKQYDRYCSWCGARMVDEDA